MTSQKHFDKSYGADLAENYEELFVPKIGRPCATALVDALDIRSGERIVDVACGTGIVSRIAAERAGKSGTVTGVDVNAGMLNVARSRSDNITWHEASADSLPLDDASADVVACSLGLQFFPDRPAAVREMYRVLRDGGRAGVLVPGPTPAPLAHFAQALARNINPQLEGFVHAVFSLNDSDEIEQLFRDAGFADVAVNVAVSPARLGPPREFLWDYVHSTPLAMAVLAATDEQRRALEEDVLEGWREYTDGGDVVMDIRNSIAITRR
jgi:ubiquinone/menaquinone biosynthesis C-methylase UbiE